MFPGKWWHHQMETFSALLAFMKGIHRSPVDSPHRWIPPVTGGFPSQRPVTRTFDVFFDMRLNKRLNKESRRHWFETPLQSLWRHCNAMTMSYIAILVCQDKVVAKLCAIKYQLLKGTWQVNMYPWAASNSFYELRTFLRQDQSSMMNEKLPAA